MWWAYAFWSAFSELLCALGFVLTEIWWAFGTLFFIDSPGGGHLVGIGWASGEVCISLFLLNGALGILVPC